MNVKLTIRDKDGKIVKLTKEQEIAVKEAEIEIKKNIEDKYTKGTKEGEKL